MTTWSRGWPRDVLFGGTWITLMPSVLNSWSSGWPGILSKVKTTLKGSPLPARYFLTSETKHWLTQSRKRILVLQAFLLYNQKTSSWCLSVPFKACLVAQMAKNLSAMPETHVWSLGWEDPLEKEMATHSSILSWNIPWTEEPDRLESMGSQRVRHNSATKQQKHQQAFFIYIFSACVKAEKKMLKIIELHNSRCLLKTFLIILPYGTPPPTLKRKEELQLSLLISLSCQA